MRGWASFRAQEGAERKRRRIKRKVLAEEDKGTGRGKRREEERCTPFVDYYV